MEIPQRVQRYAEFNAIPHVTEITIGSSYGDGVNPPEALSTIKGVRVVEVKRMGELGCTLVLSDCRWDLKNLVCPSDFMLKFRDGFLNGTKSEDVREALAYIAAKVPTLAALLASDAYDAFAGDAPKLTGPMLLSGMELTAALGKLLDTVNMDLTVGMDGLVRYVRRGNINDSSVPPLGAYLWMLGGMPSWLDSSRGVKGLPRKIIAQYPERHALRMEATDSDETQTTASGGPLAELRISLEQVYSRGGKFMYLDDLLVDLKLQRSDLNNEMIAKVYFTQHFEGTPLGELSKAGDPHVAEAIAIVKRDWRSLHRMVFTDRTGRMGGWTDLIAGKFKTTADKDGDANPAGAVEGKAVESKWVEIFSAAIAEHTGGTQTLEGATVALTHLDVPAGNTLPSAPFSVIVESEGEGVLRLVQNTSQGFTDQAVLGELVPNSSIHIKRVDTITNDQGQTVRPDFDLQWPSPEQFRLDKSWLMYLFMVATRRLPNDAAKWTRIEIDGFADGGVDVGVELEVGDELYALRDYVAPRLGKPAEGDGLGRVLNRAALEEDANRRAMAYKRDVHGELEGQGLSLGTPLCHDLNHPSGAISELRVEVRGLSVRSHIECGNLGDISARAKRAQAREARRTIASGGQAVV